MSNALQRVAARALGLPSPDHVRQLENDLKFAIKKLGRSTASGVEMQWGKYEHEFNANLRGSKLWDTLDKMEADPHVKGALRSNALPLQTAEWTFQPASDKPKDVEVAEFCSANLLRENSDRFGRDHWLHTPWKGQRLPEILSMLRDGFALFQRSFRRAGSRVVYDRLQWLEPATITRWVLDEQDMLVGIVRDFEAQRGSARSPVTRQYNEIFTPIEDLKLYVWDLKGARYNGRAMVRSMYGAWFRKDFIQRISVIWAQKTGAPVPIGVYPHGWNEEQRAVFEVFVQSLLGHEPAKAWGAFERSKDGQAAEITYAGAKDSEPDRSTSLIRAENEEISHAAGTKHSMLGETQTGSRALGDSIGMTDMMGVEAVVEVLSEQEAHGVGNVEGVVDELVRLNFPGIRELPVLSVPKLNVFAQQQLVKDLVIPGIVAGVIPRHPEVRKQITDMAGITGLPDEAFEDEPVPVLQPGRDPGDEDDAEPEDEQTEDETEQVAARLAARDDFRRRIESLLAPVQEGAPGSGGGFRHPTRLEAAAVNLAAVNQAFDHGQRDALTVLRRVQREMVDDLMGRLRAGKITPRSLPTQRRSGFRKTRRVKAEHELQTVFRATAMTGAGHVEAEIAAQRPGGPK